MMDGILMLLQEREAFRSCQIEGIYPQHWTFDDYLTHKTKERQKHLRAVRKMQKAKALNLQKQQTNK